MMNYPAAARTIPACESRSAVPGESDRSSPRAPHRRANAVPAPPALPPGPDGGAPATRLKYRRALSSAAPLFLVVVLRVVLDSPEQAGDVRLAPAGDVFPQRIAQRHAVLH